MCAVLPGIFSAGMRLRSAWPELPGAVGMWLWSKPWPRECGSVSVWRDEDALMRFAAWPDHVAIMKEYRQRGRLRSTTWTAEQFDPSAVWQAALPHLNDR